MEEPIKKDDLVVNGALASIKKDIDALAASTNKWDEELKAAAETLKNAVGGTNKTTLENLNKLNAAEKESARLAKEKKTVVKNQNLLDQEKTKLQKQILVEEAKLKIARSDENKQLLELRAAKNAENKAIRDGIRDKENDKNAYSKLSRESREFKNESKRLGAELIALGSRTEKNAATWDKLEKEYKQVTQQAITTDAQLKKIDATVGDNQRNVGNYKDALGGLNGALGALGLALGVGQVASGIFNFNKDLDTATNTARMFFKTTDEGSKALAQEATILGKVWGKETNEILLAANVLTKEFGISGEEALAKINEGFNKGADVQGEFLSNIKEYSSQLTQAGLTAEQSIALITQSQEAGVFSDKGVDAIKEAQLALREMTKPAQEALAAIGMSGEELQKQIQSGQKTYFEAIQEISAKTNEFGIGSQEAGMILADVFKGAGEDAGQFIFSLDKLNLNLDEMDDASQGMDAALGNLTRSFYEFMFGVNDAGGVTDKFAGVIQFLANNLGTILSTLGKLIIGYAAYRTMLIAVNIVQAIQQKGLKGIAKEFFNVSKGADVAEKSNSKLGKTLKAIGWAAIAALAYEVAAAIWDIASGAARARFETELLEKAQARFSGVATKLVDNLNSKLDKQIKLIQQRRELGKITAEEEKKQIEEAIALADKQVRSGQENVNKQIKQKEAQLNMINEVLDANEFAAGFAEIGSDVQNFLGINNATDVINMASKLEAELKALKETEILLSNESGRLRDRTSDLNHEFKVQEVQSKGVTDATKEQAKAVKEVRIETEKLHELDASILEDGTQDLSFDSLAGLNESFDQEFKLFELNLRKQDLTQEEFDAKMLEKQREILEKRILLYRKFGIDTTDLELE